MLIEIRQTARTETTVVTKNRNDPHIDWANVTLRCDVDAISDCGIVS